MTENRRHIGTAALLSLMICLACLPVRALQCRAAEDLSEWTVMFYLCGSDLESKYGFASGCLQEMNECYVRENRYADVLEQEAEDSRLPGELILSSEPALEAAKVNVLIETGGTREWHAQDLGLEIDPDKLQRWRFTVGGKEEGNTFTLEQELPSADMADPETLSDFIRWGAQAAPARKYAIVLWDHGGGSKTGLFIDELYEGSVMYLDELGQAFADGGIFFETVVLDACMMANLETGAVLKDHAAWMVASEEVVGGPGTAVNGWLQELYNYPECGGERLGRLVCDKTQIKYANQREWQFSNILTMSVIDLGRMDRVLQGFDFFFQTACEMYERSPFLVSAYAHYANTAEEYGSGTEKMKDFASIFYNPDIMGLIVTRLRTEILDAVEDAVAYCVRGPGRSSAYGLSFCYAVSFGEEELDLYARNCPSPWYLAFLDAISAWTAPDEVYDTARRLREISTIPEYRVEVELCVRNGMPVLRFDGNEDTVGAVYYRMYRYNENTGRTVLLGITPCSKELGEAGEIYWRPGEPAMWPAIEGQLCDIELIRDMDTTYLYNIPVQIGTSTLYFRCGRSYNTSKSERIFGAGDVDRSSEYEIYGVWEGYDSDTSVINRNVTSLSQLAGQEFTLLYPVLTGAGVTGYETSTPQTIYRALDIEEIPLEPGTYYLEYEICDMFMRGVVSSRAKMNWDGEDFTLAEDAVWDGTLSLN